MLYPPIIEEDTFSLNPGKGVFLYQGRRNGKFKSHTLINKKFPLISDKKGASTESNSSAIINIKILFFLLSIIIIIIFFFF